MPHRGRAPTHPFPVAARRAQEIDPYAHLVDLLQRIDRYPATRATQRVPRRWKTLFAAPGALIHTPSSTEQDTARGLLTLARPFERPDEKRH
jgi:hypothetical protein